MFFPFYMGGGCLSALMAPIFCLVLAVILLVGVIMNGVSTLASGGNVVYNENRMQDYANEQYAAIYDPSSDTYEDNVLIVFLTNEDGQNYYCIGWTGDNLKRSVSNLYGNEYTALGKAMNSSINQTSYRYSLGSNLADVTEQLQAAVEDLGLETVYDSASNGTHSAGQVYNKSQSDIQFNSETVDNALKRFTEATDLSMSIVVADSADVFGKTLGASAILTVLVCLVLIVYAVVSIVRYYKHRKEDADSWR